MTTCIPDIGVGLAAMSRGRMTAASHANASGWFRLPTDPLGFITATFDGVNANSEIRVYPAAGGAELAGVELCAANPTLVWGVYSGADLVVIRIVHTAYKIKEFTYTAQKGSVVIPVQQEPDKWYSNPA